MADACGFPIAVPRHSDAVTLGAAVTAAAATVGNKWSCFVTVPYWVLTDCLFFTRSDGLHGLT